MRVSMSWYEVRAKVSLSPSPNPILIAVLAKRVWDSRWERCDATRDNAGRLAQAQTPVCVRRSRVEHTTQPALSQRHACSQGRFAVSTNTTVSHVRSKFRLTLFLRAR